MFVRDLGLKYVRDPCPATAPPRPLHPARSTHSVPLQPLDLCPMFQRSTPTPHSRAALRFSTPAHGCRLSFSLPWCRPGSHRTRCTHRSLCFPLRHAGLFPRDRLFFSAAVVGVPDAPRAVPASPAPLAPCVAPALAPDPLVLWMASAKGSVAESGGPDCATPLARVAAEGARRGARRGTRRGSRNVARRGVERGWGPKCGP
jgi:hypothetical protein